MLQNKVSGRIELLYKQNRINKHPPHSRTVLRTVDTYKSTMILLGVFFVFYIVADLATTSWLIHNDPAGIKNENNPIAVYLYNNYGEYSLFIAKIVGFSAIASILFYIDKRFAGRLEKAKRIVMIILISLFVMVTINNTYAILKLL